MKELGFKQSILDSYNTTSKPTYLIKLDGKEDYSKVGNSRLGGVPDLPSNFKYPIVIENGQIKHYVFIAQINLTEIPSNSENILPNNGMLYFFIHNDNESMSKVEHLVLYSKEIKELKKFEVPHNVQFTGTSYTKPFTSQKITFKPERSIDLYHLSENHSAYLESKADFYQIFDRKSRLEGYHYGGGSIIEANIIQELEVLPYEETFFLTSGYLIGHKLYSESNQFHLDYYNKKIKESQNEDDINKHKNSIQEINDKIELEKRLLTKKEYYKDLLNKWKLILAIDSVDECGMLWWDASMLEFYINTDYLSNEDFSKTFCIINH